MPSLWETDSYYPLAVARLYVEEGISAKPPWGRFSLIGEGGDKEYLFHLLLVPFVRFLGPGTGGRIALAAIDATIFTVVASAAVEMIGWPGLLVPVWMFVAVAPFTSRLLRIRPELAALVIIIAGVTYWPVRRDRFLALLALLFTSAYTAFHVFAALSMLWLACDFFVLRLRPRWSLFYPVAGCVAGGLAHPHFPRYPRISVAPKLLYFFHWAQLHLGAEIVAPDRALVITCVP